MKKFVYLSVSGRRLILSSAALLISAAAYSGAFAASVREVPDSVALDEAIPTIDEETLEEVVVSAPAKLVTSDGAKITYEAANDPEASTSSLIDILRKVPGVTVDGEGNVKVNGQSSFKILMDNREDPMLKGDLKTVLKSIPASSIIRIEVINEPGAKYDAEGGGGILNLVTRRNQRQQGYSGDVSASYMPDNAGVYASLRAKVDKVTTSASVNYAKGLGTRHYDSFSLTDYLDSDLYSRRETRQRGKMNSWDWIGANINASWEPDTLNLFTLGFNVGSNGWGDDDTSRVTTQFDKAGNAIYDYNMLYASKGHYTSLGVIGSYQHTFGKPEHALTVSYTFDWGRSRNNDNSEITEINGDMNMSDIRQYRFESSDQMQFDRSHVAQLDYANPFNGKNLLEAGLKLSFNDDDSDTQLFGGEDSQTVQTRPGGLDLLNFRHIYAAYASWKGSYGKWGLKAGIRYEHTRMGLDYRTAGYNDFTRHLNDWCPNAAVSYNLTMASTLRLAYLTRIERPSIYQLNPYVDQMIPGSKSYGNPDLDASQYHSVSFSYSNYDHPLSGEAKIQYTRSDNVIWNVSFVEDNIINQTYDNVGQTNRARLSLMLNWNLHNNFLWSVNGSTDYFYGKAVSEMLTAKRCGWSYNINTNISYKFPMKLRLSGFGGYSSKRKDINYESDPFYYYGLGLSRGFLKEEALQLSVNAMNFLPARRSMSSQSYGTGLVITNSFSFTQWQIGVSLSYHFGKLRDQVKKTRADIEQSSGPANTGSRPGM